MQRIVILGAGGHGHEVLDIVSAVNAVAPTYDFLGFLDDGIAVQGGASQGGVLGPIAELERIDADYLVGVASPDVRRKLDGVARGWGRTPATVVHPAATVGIDVRLGPGAVLAAGVRITTRVSLGRQVHCNVNATINHDCVVGDYTTLTPGARLAGSVTVGDGCYLGIGSVVIEGVKLGEGTVVGAGAAVIRDTSAGVTVVGVPARRLAR